MTETVNRRRWLQVGLLAVLAMASSRGAADDERPPSGWIAALPTIDSVAKAIAGQDANDTAIRQAAAFEVLKDVVNIFAGAELGLPVLEPMLSDLAHLPPVVRTRREEYTRAADSTFRGAKAPVWRLRASSEFRREVVTKTMSVPISEVYFRLNASRIAAARNRVGVDETNQSGEGKVPNTTKAGQPAYTLPFDHLPSITDVHKAMHSWDFDSAAMEAAVFNQLAQVVRSRSGTDESAKLTSRERALADDYERSAADADAKGERLAASDGAPLTGGDSYVTRWFAKRRAYDTTAGLLRSTWTRPGQGALGGDKIVPWFPTLSVDLRKWSGAQFNTVAALAGKASDAAARRPAAWKPPSPDPSVAAAAAASPPTDMTVLGNALRLGEPFLLPPCPPTTDNEDIARIMSIGSKQVDKTCARLAMSIGTLAETMIAWAGAGSSTVVDVPEARRPDWMRAISVTVENDLLLAVAIATVGDALPDELVRKYRLRPAPKKGDRAREWSVPGLHIVYVPRHELFGPDPAEIVIGTPLELAADAIGRQAQEQGRAQTPNVLIETDTHWLARRGTNRKREAAKPF
jgi:hypothetical protein